MILWRLSSAPALGRWTPMARLNGSADSFEERTMRIWLLAALHKLDPVRECATI